jgi:hypothetical protein
MLTIMRRTNLGYAGAFVYAAISAAVVAFQIALAAGAPWGAYAMGGAFPGRFPPGLRVAAAAQATVVVAMAAVVLSRAGVAFSAWSRAARRLIWVVVVIAAVSLVLNLATPSAAERVIWAPVAAVLLGSSFVVARRGRRDESGGNEGGTITIRRVLSPDSPTRPGPKDATTADGPARRAGRPRRAPPACKLILQRSLSSDRPVTVLGPASLSH